MRTRQTALIKWLFWIPGLLFLPCAWLAYRSLKAALAADKEGLLGVLQHPSAWLVVFAVATLIIGGMAWAALDEWMKQPSTARGSAHWAYGREMRVYTARRGENALTLGRVGWQRIAITEKRQYEHISIVGTTGKGKTSQFFIPFLLSESGNRSVFVLDAKSELVTETAGALAEQHHVRVFAPTRPAASHRYNPLAHIHSFEDALDFARCWVDNTGRSKEPFWGNVCEQLIAGTVLHLHATEPAAPLSRLAEILGELSLEELQTFFARSPSKEARKLVAPALAYMVKNERLVGSIFTDLTSRLVLLQSETIQQITATNEIDFESMTQEPTALFFCIPDGGMQRLSPLACSFLMQMFATRIRLADQQPQQTSTLPMVCYLDEFGTVGSIPRMAEHIATLRSRQVALIMAAQNFAQLEERYGKAGAETILSNASTHLVLRGTGQREAEWYSRRIGETTIVTYTQRRRGLWDADAQRAESSRRLITPDEIRTMPENRILVLADVAPPLLVSVKPYYRVKHLAQRARLPFTLRPSTPSPGSAPSGSGGGLLPPPQGGSSPQGDRAPD